LIGFLIGLLIGWWVIGWGLWPVQWTNALPPDLRAAERDEYLLMVAESYAATRNAEVARSRLSSWSPQALSQDLSNLQARVASNPQQAVQVLALSELVGATKTAGPGGQAPGAGPVATPRPGATPSSTTGADAVATLRTVGMLLLWLVLLSAAVAVVIYLWRRWRAAHAAPSGPMIDASARPARVPPPLQPSLSDVGPEEEQWTSNYPPVISQGDALEPQEKAAATAESESSAAPRSAEASAPVRPTTTGAAPPPKTTAATGAGALAAAAKVGEFRPHYIMGEPDYDEPFDIIDSAGGYLGQCGLELNDPVGRGRDQAAALQIWLWDTNDQDTKVKVLMSEGAYRDTAIRNQLKGEHEALPIRPGAEFELNSYKLVLRGFVDRLEYVSMEPANTVFSDLQLRIVVYRKS
jgi:hypothetical protein